MISVQGVLHPHFLYLMDSILQESLNDKFWYGWIILEKPNKFYASVAKHFGKHC